MFVWLWQHRSTLSLVCFLQADPLLGGFVAAVRRNPADLPAEKRAELDEIGFLWVVTRACGSAWMATYRQLKDFYETNGHTDVARELGDEHALSKWCAAMAESQQSGDLSPKRAAYLSEVRFGE